MPEDLLSLPPAVEAWRRAEASRRHPVLDRLEKATQALPERNMQTAAAQAELLAFLVELTGARLIVEVGTFTGYGALAMALALPEGGRLITLDVGDWDRLGDRHWEEAGVAHKIERRLGLAEESLDTLSAGPEAGGVDLVYVDADKKLYPRYLDQSRRLVRSGGLIALDNLFWGGAVAEEGDDDARQVEALRRVARQARDDDGLAMTLVPIADGLLLARRR